MSLGGLFHRWRRLRILLDAWRDEARQEPYPEMDIVLQRYYAASGGEDGQREGEGRPRQEGPPQEEEPLS